MENESCFAVIGGDMRSAYLAGSLAADGFTVYSAGLENAGYCGDSVIMTDVFTAIRMSAIIIFPLPVVRVATFLNAPFSMKSVSLDERMLEALQGKRIFAGMSEGLKRISRGWEILPVIDYYKVEEFQILNALATAEGALALALIGAPYVLNGSKCLVSGYGRIGKMIASKLKALGAEVYVAARKSTDLAWIETMGYAPIRFEELKSVIRNIDIVFNTVPKLVINEGLIAQMKRSSMLIDLASYPGGIDLRAAEKYGIRTEFAPGLPGKYSPFSSALIIKDTVRSILREAQK
ncbi:MAG: dipicolinate synthase subunit DpsA [Oscillospiraceae bacterium]|nr:dipicolinate synthase subunit DpsA [Oscillospiraceae bacterium]